MAQRTVQQAKEWLEGNATALNPVAFAQFQREIQAVEGDGVGYTATNAPAGGMEPGAVSSVWNGRARVDARRATHFRTWHVLTAAVAANGVRFEYSTDIGGTWATLLDVGAGNAVLLSPWAVMPDLAKVGDLVIRAMVYGDGVADPVLRRA